jgi:hypothetical protein
MSLVHTRSLHQQVHKPSSRVVGEPRLHPHKSMAEIHLKLPACKARLRAWVCDKQIRPRLENPNP